MQTKKILVIGAGPTGLGAAYRLQELGYENWELYEKSDHVGGHSTSHVDEKGFVWDEGGHVIFSHYPYFDQLVERMLGPDVHERIRESWITTGDTWVPYPFQNNLRFLPKAVQLECLLGAAKAAANAGGGATNFRDWILATFGEGIARAFMFPYNLKVWTTPLDQMSKSWIGERVSVVDFKRLLENVLYERDDVSWGPNNKFKFPLHGGTGEIYRRMAQCFPSKLHCGKKLAEVNLNRRTVSFEDGSGDTFDFLISTAPLDLLAQALKPADPRLLEAAAELQHNDLLVLGIGLEKKIETGRCWIYFPDEDMPCYRTTYFSHYSPFNVPNGDTEHYSSFMSEVSVPPGKKLDPQKAMEAVIDGLIRARILEPADRAKVVSRYHQLVSYSYPIPTLGRDRVLGILQPALMDQGVYSRGRFGAWRYEIGNMDHSVMMGVEAVNHLISGEAESVFHGS
ncbi:MAG: protoporphyrinogen/coproporphyrinogen oxidase [Terriglobales bacterium]